MRRLVLFIEIAFVLLIISIIYRRYIRPFRQAWRSAKGTAQQQQQQYQNAYREQQRGPVQETQQSRVNANPHKPIDRSNVQDAEFEDLS